LNLVRRKVQEGSIHFDARSPPEGPQFKICGRELPVR
jgi:hypothetical protein